MGKTIRLDDQNFLVTGVMPASFDFPLATELWTPYALTAEQRGSRRANLLEAVVRLKPGRTFEQAAAELANIGAHLEKSYPDTNKNRHLLLWTAGRYLVEHESPLGKRIRLGGPDSRSPWLTIAGVVGDIAYNPYDRQPRRVIYVPYQQAPALSMDIGVRTAGDPLRVAPAVTAAIRSVDREQPITDMQTMAKAIHNRAIGLNYMAALMGIFGALALCLSAIGVYGVMASEQTHEIGIRMALGAARQSVLGMIFRRGMTTIAAGLGVGLPLAWGFARLMASLVFGVTASDPATFVGIPLALIAAAALAIYIPARRAMLIDPIVALRYE